MRNLWRDLKAATRCGDRFNLGIRLSYPACMPDAVSRSENQADRARSMMPPT